MNLSDSLNLRRFLFSIFLTLVVLFSHNALSSELAPVIDGMNQIDYDEAIIPTVGDTLDSLDFETPLNRCVVYDDEDFKYDTLGSTEANLRFYLIRNFDELENDFKFSISSYASAKANVAKIVSGSASFKGSGKIENFLTRQHQSMMLVLEANAKYGRQLITQYNYSDEYQTLLAEGNFEKVREQCGTHFVRGFSNVSKIRVSFTFSNLSTGSKTLISNSFKGEGGGGFSIGDLGAETKSSLSTSISNTLSLASKLGKVSISVDTVGGAGISTIGKVLSSAKITDVSTIDQLIDALVKAADDFTYENSAPDTLLIAQHPYLQSAQVEYASIDFDLLGEIYRQLLRIDGIRNTLESYRTEDPHLWEKYFRVLNEQVDLARAELAKRYQQCRLQGECDYESKIDIPGYFLNDVIFDGTLVGECVHSYEFTDDGDPSNPEKFDVLSSISLIWTGRIRFIEEVDTRATEILQITPALDLEDIKFNAPKQMRLATPDSNNEARMYVSVNHIPVIEDDISVAGKLNEEKLMELRKFIAQSIYVARFFLLNGQTVEVPLGYPDLSACDVVKPSS